MCYDEDEDADIPDATGGNSEKKSGPGLSELDEVEQCLTSPALQKLATFL